MNAPSISRRTSCAAPATLALVALLVAASPAAAELPPRVHPAGPTVPENLLHIELRFATPQALPFDVARLVLRDAATGMPIDGALLDLALPDASGRRIAVLMDPGRVKRGVGPNVEAGRALEAGRAVQLLMAEGPQRRLRTLKTWQVVAAVQAPLPLGTWRVLASPRIGSREALLVDLGAPISAAAEGLIAVVDGSRRRIAGAVTLERGDSLWRFVPQRPWRAGALQVLASPQLEDPAGNRPCAAFETAGLSAAACELPPALAFAPRRRAAGRL